MNRAWALQSLLLLASVVFIVALAEITARAFDVKPYQTRLERYEFDDTLGWRTHNSFTTYISKRRYAHYLHYNKDGFPSSEASVARSASRQQTSVALIGDSFIEGYYLPFEQTLAYSLEQSIDKQILNLGVSGYSPGQYLLMARKHLPDFNVTDVVVFIFAFNDIPYVSLDMYRGYAKPLVSHETFEIENFPLHKKAGDEAETRGLMKNILDKFAIWSLIKPVFVMVEQTDGVVLKPERLDPGELQRALKLISRINTEFPHANFHVYYIPDITELKTEDVFQFNIASFKQSCSQIGLNCITPDPFAQHDPDDLYIPDDHHLSALGAQLVANHVTELLTAEK
jgi:lysophospholipase L1-like esterase